MKNKMNKGAAAGWSSSSAAAMPHVRLTEPKPKKHRKRRKDGDGGEPETNLPEFAGALQQGGVFSHLGPSSANYVGYNYDSMAHF